MVHGEISPIVHLDQAVSPMFVVITTRQPLLFSFKRSIYAGMTVLWATRCTENVRRQLTRDVKPNVTGVPGFWLLTALALNVINSVVDNF